MSTRIFNPDVEFQGKVTADTTASITGALTLHSGSSIVGTNTDVFNHDEQVSSDPSISGLARAIGSTCYTVDGTSHTVTGSWVKTGSGTTAWSTFSQISTNTTAAAAAQSTANSAIAQIAAGIASTRLGLAITRGVNILAPSNAEMSRLRLINLSGGGPLIQLNGGGQEQGSVYLGGGFLQSYVPSNVPAAYSIHADNVFFPLNTCTKWYVEGDLIFGGNTAQGQVGGIGFRDVAGYPVTAGVGVRWSTAYSALWYGDMGMSPQVDLIPLDGNMHSCGAYRNGSTTGLSADLVSWTTQGLNGWASQGATEAFQAGINNISSSTTSGIVSLFWRNVMGLVITPA